MESETEIIRGALTPEAVAGAIIKVYIRPEKNLLSGDSSPLERFLNRKSQCEKKLYAGRNEVFIQEVSQLLLEKLTELGMADKLEVEYRNADYRVFYRNGNLAYGDIDTNRWEIFLVKR